MKGEPAKPEKTLYGIGVSPGVAVGPVFVLTPARLDVPARTLDAAEVDHEISRFEDALIETRRQIKQLQRALEDRTDMGDASILDAHLMVLDDRSLVEEVIERIRRDCSNAEAVVKVVTDRYAGVLASMQDDYMRERVVDVKDVSRRIIRNLCGVTSPSLEGLDAQRNIVVARDLTPTETAGIRKETVHGFATEVGSPTSHTAVMARALDIPAVVGLGEGLTAAVLPGDEVLIDGNKGVLIVNPTHESLRRYGQVVEIRRKIEQEIRTSMRDAPAVTSDGHRVVIAANAKGIEDVEAIRRHGAEGIGLYRTEYAYLRQQGVFPEEEQFVMYRDVARQLAPAPVVIRTLDIGGDKVLSVDEFRAEANPFLGCRSIRLSLMYPDRFKRQLRAILRASGESDNLHMMFPMVSNVRELRRARELLEECREALRAEGRPFAESMEVGIMVELPSAAMTADILARHVDFFSLGTNDLVQYTMGVDRLNERVAYLYEPTHPAVLRLMQRTVDAGHKAGIWVGVCGEMAADPILTPLLLGLGVDELSMSPSAVPLVKDAVRKNSFARSCALAEEALECSEAGDVVELCRELMRETAPELLELA